MSFWLTTLIYFFPFYCCKCIGCFISQYFKIYLQLYCQYIFVYTLYIKSLVAHLSDRRCGNTNEHKISCNYPYFVTLSLYLLLLFLKRFGDLWLYLALISVFTSFLSNELNVVISSDSCLE